jgi:hypothetical protein
VIHDNEKERHERRATSDYVLGGVNFGPAYPVASSVGMGALPTFVPKRELDAVEKRVAKLEADFKVLREQLDRKGFDFDGAHAVTS